MQKKEQTIRATGDGHSNDSRLIDKIVEWIKEHWVGVTFVIIIIGLIMNFIGKN